MRPSDPSIGSDQPPAVGRPRTTRSPRMARPLVLAAATVAEIAVLRAPRHSVTSAVIVILAALLVGALVVCEHRDPRIGVAPVAAAIALVITASAVNPPRTSNDVWSYALYGRIVTVHDASPYERV